MASGRQDKRLGRAAPAQLASLGKLTLVWTQVSGPGTTTFSTPAAANTDVRFDRAGTYGNILNIVYQPLQSSKGCRLVSRGYRAINP